MRAITSPAYGLSALLALTVAPSPQVSGLPFPGAIYDVVPFPRVIAGGDFNEDGEVDLVVGNGSRVALSLLLGRGDGSFASPVTLTTGSTSDLVVADFNNDDHDDIAFPDGTGKMVVLPGDGAGGLAAPIRSSSLPEIFRLATGDLDEDGRTDLVATSLSPADISLLRGNGDGTFASRVSLAVPGLPLAVQVGDFDDDGHDDLAVGYRATLGDDGVAIYLGHGDGSFATPPPSVAVEEPFALQVGDLDGDGHQDVVVVSSTMNSIRALIGRGDGSFDSHGPFPCGSRPLDLELGDVNGDGHQDVVTVNSFYLPGSQSDISVLIGNGDGGFLPERRVTAALGGPPVGLVLSDLDHDGDLDIAEVDRIQLWSLTIRPGHGDGTFGSPMQYPAGFFPYAVELADIDHDGIRDALVANQDFVGLHMLRGGPAGTFGPPIPLTPASEEAVNGLVVKDFDGDGWHDAALLLGGRNAIDIFVGRPDGTFRFNARHNVGLTPFAIAGADLNGDGRWDLVTANLESNDVSVLLGAGDGGFDPEVRVAAGQYPVALAIADIDGDGRPDVAVSNSQSGEVSILHGVGGGGLGPRTHFDAGFYPRALAVGDVDSDGVADVVVVHPLDDNISILHGEGAGVLAPPTFVGTGDYPSGLALVDCNADGHLDIAVTNGGSGSYGSISVLLGRGGGGLAPELRFRTGASPLAIVAADIDADLRPDLVIVDNYLSSLTVLLNEAPYGDTDGDGTPDDADTCTDRDGDGYGDPGIPFNICPADDCGAIANPGQEDEDADGAGDACDNCPGLQNMSQSDADRDGIGDACDPCTDVDGDGFGNQGYPANTCAPDLCPLFPETRQADADGDGVGDACDLCTDQDGDGLGDGRLPASICAADDCPDVADPGQADYDHDGIGNACDPCTDFDRDGYGDPALPASTCPHDNCTTRYNPDQADFDGDRVGDICDSCTDTDDDEFGNPGFANNACPADNCPNAANHTQSDRDADRVGDACDPCTDYDRDGYGDPDLPATTCALDNCPVTYNPDQQDLDHDGQGDLCDTCMDIDHDGFGNPGFPLNTCAPDNCPSIPNAFQADVDLDHQGDLCDPCPVDPLNDADGDGRCADLDNCPAGANPAQEDGDGDGPGDLCDNCPVAPNPGQEDWNSDGSGDACQPTVAIPGIAALDATTLVARIDLRDPQHDALSGTIRLTGPVDATITLQDAGYTYDCALGFLPDGVAGEGIGYVGGSVGQSVLFDLDSSFACVDSQPDYLLAEGPCDNPVGGFDIFLPLPTMSGSSLICARRHDQGNGGVTFTVVQYDDASLTAVVRLADGLVSTTPFVGLLPSAIPLAPLLPEDHYTLHVDVTDGNTVPVSGAAVFFHRQEQTLVLTGSHGNDGAPQAVLSVQAVIECTRAGAGSVTLDGSASSDPDSSPGTNDDIEQFDWFENFGAPGETSLGAGEVIDVVLPLGTHRITLRVTDQAGHQSIGATSVAVVDTQPPTLMVVAEPGALWPPNHAMAPVQIRWGSGDDCDPSRITVQLLSVTSSEPEDAPGNNDGATTDDIQGADAGTADGTVLLRVERDGRGHGRVYTLTYRAVDAGGNAVSALATVVVPHDQGQGPEPLLLRLEPIGPGTVSARVYWPAIGGATGYDVISGDLSAMRVESGVLNLGPVRVLARSTTATAVSESLSSPTPAVGQGYFYLVQQRTGLGAVGYGTETASWPRVPGSCDGGCP